MAYKKRVMALAEQKYGEQYAQYIERQNYLKNTNITVLAMPGFMEAVEQKRFYPATFDKKSWNGPSTIHENRLSTRKPAWSR